MICPKTWPNYKGSVKDGVRALCKYLRLSDHESSPSVHDVALGKSKIFISKARTLTMLEEEREKAIPGIVVKMQAVWRRAIAIRYMKKQVVLFQFMDLQHVLEDTGGDGVPQAVSSREQFRRQLCYLLFMLTCSQC